MPIDPSIPLAIRPPEPVNFLGMAAQAQQLKNAGLQNQLQQQGLQSGQLQLQQQQQELQDQQTLRQAYGQSGGDLDKLQQLIAGKVSPKTMMALNASILDQKTKLAGLKKEDLANLQTTNDQLAGLLSPVAAETDPVKQQALWGGAQQEAIKRGLMTPQDAAQHPYPGVQGVPQYINGLKTQDQLIKEAQATAEQTRASAAASQAQTAGTRLTLETPGIQSDTLQKQRTAAATQLAFSKNQADYEQKLGQLDPQVAATFPPQFDRWAVLQAGMKPAEISTEAHQRIGEQQRQQQIGVETGQLGVARQRLGIEQQRLGFEQGGGISQAAKALVAGDIDPQTARAMVRNNPGLISQARTLDPSFDMADIDKRYETLKEFTSSSNSKAGGQVLALNTMIHHADLFYDVADALKNGSFQPGNEVYNRVATTFGAAPANNAALVGQFLAGEVGKLAQGGSPFEAELRKISSSLSTASSPEQIRGAAQTLMQIGAGRATPLMEKAKDAKLDNVVHVIGPDAQSILQKRGFDPNTMKPVRGSAGPAPQSPFQIGQQVTLKTGKKVTITAVHPDGTFDAK